MEDVPERLAGRSQHVYNTLTIGQYIGMSGWSARGTRRPDYLIQFVCPGALGGAIILCMWCARSWTDGINNVGGGEEFNRPLLTCSSLLPELLGSAARPSGHTPLQYGEPEPLILLA